MAKNERRFDGDAFLLVGKGLTPRRASDLATGWRAKGYRARAVRRANGTYAVYRSRERQHKPRRVSFMIQEKAPPGRPRPKPKRVSFVARR